MTQTADVVVIGGGIIGCACAYYLARDRHRVVLIERGEIASGAASASGGWIVIQNKETPEQVSLAMASRKLYDDLVEDAGVQLLATGGLILAVQANDGHTLRHQAEVARAGGAVVEELDGSALHEVEPALSIDLVGALHCTDEGVVDPPMVCQTLARCAIALGARIWTDTTVTGIEIDDSRVTRIMASRGAVATRTVVCAGGAWSSQIGAMVGLEIPVTPRRGHLIVTEAEGIIRRPMLEAAYLELRDEQPGDQATTPDGRVVPWSPGSVSERTPADDPFGIRFVMQPRVDGRCFIGSTREFGGFDREVNLDLVQRMQSLAARFVPAVAQSGIARVTVGFRPYAPGGQPLIGRAGPEGFVVATGHEGEGVTLAPVTGHLVADLIAARIDRTGLELQMTTPV